MFNDVYHNCFQLVHHFCDGCCKIEKFCSFKIIYARNSLNFRSKYFLLFFLIIVVPVSPVALNVK